VINRAATGYLGTGGPAITVAESEQVTIRENLLYGLPAVVLQARIAQIAQNRILGGGVWVADGSADVHVESNEISRGAGAGVVLGGVPATLKLSDRDTGVETVHIVDNTITGMQDSGITSVIDIEQDLDLGELEDIHIRQNRIRHCALGGPNPAYDPIAAGGIVLRSVAGLAISDNLITNNGGEDAPACGIFTFFCTGLQVTDNRIAENGSTGEEGAAEGARAYQAGIAALYAVGGELSDPVLGAGTTFQTAGPAAMIHDNIVVCPRGQALIAGALGPVSISGNTFTSQGPRRQPRVNQADVISALAVLGQSVFVVNLGRTPGFGGAAAGFAAAPRTRYNPAIGLAAARGQILPDGRTLFHGNQVTLEILENAPPYLLSSATIVSFDDVSIQDNQVLTQILGGVVMSSVVALGITVRAHANRIHELPRQAMASYLSLGLMNNATGNQGTHCILVGGTLKVDSDNQVAVTTLCERLRAVTGAPAVAMPSVGIGNFAVRREDVIIER
jgi:hypothetical protein